MHRHRAFTHDEASRLIRAAETGRVELGMGGPDRARLYMVALGTGFRTENCGARLQSGSTWR
jgi:hypothetical protein